MLICLSTRFNGTIGPCPSVFRSAKSQANLNLQCTSPRRLKNYVSHSSNSLQKWALFRVRDLYECFNTEFTAQSLFTGWPGRGQCTESKGTVLYVRVNHSYSWHLLCPIWFVLLRHFDLRMCSIEPGTIDLLCFPEMILSGKLISLPLETYIYVQIVSFSCWPHFHVLRLCIRRLQRDISVPRTPAGRPDVADVRKPCPEARMLCLGWLSGTALRSWNFEPGQCRSAAYIAWIYLQSPGSQILHSAENTGISDVTDAISTPGSSIVGANSAVLCGPNGYFIGNYRKTNLFATDRTWAKAG